MKVQYIALKNLTEPEYFTSIKDLKESENKGLLKGYKIFKLKHYKKLLLK